MNRIHVAVIFGGMSSEHSISCLSAANVVAAIDAERFDVTGIGISPEGVWVRYGIDEILDLPSTGQLPTVEVGDRPRCQSSRWSRVPASSIPRAMPT